MFRRIINRYGSLLVKVFLALAPAILLLYTQVQLPRIDIVDKISHYVVSPLSDLFGNTAGGVGVVWNKYISLVDTKIENEKLKKQIDALNNKILSFEEMARENARLKELVAFREIESFVNIKAKVIGQDSSQFSVGYLINIGSKDGIAEFDPVITPRGVVGSIVKVYPYYSYFVSIEDPSHRIDGILEESRAHVIVEGRGKGLLAKLKYLDRARDVRVGDKIMSSGLDGRFPKGLLIGTINQVNRPSFGILQDASIKTSSEIEKIEEVIVLKKQKTEFGSSHTSGGHSG